MGKKVRNWAIVSLALVAIVLISISYAQPGRSRYGPTFWRAISGGIEYVTGNVTVTSGNLDVTGSITATKTTEQMRLAYDVNNYVTFVVDVNGHMELGGSGINRLDLGGGSHFHTADIHFSGAPTTYISFGDGIVRHFSQGFNMLQLYASIFGDEYVAVNSSGVDIDFIVKGDNDPNLIYADAANDRVGIGTATPKALVDMAGNFCQAVVTIDPCDATPDVSGGSIFETSANGDATEITDLDSPVVGQVIHIIGGSATNSSTIADGGNFALSAGWTANVDDVLTLFVQADNDYIELGRVDN